MVRRGHGEHHQPGRHRGVHRTGDRPPRPLTRAVADRLRAAGVLRPEAEAAELAAALVDPDLVAAAVERRVAGEPLPRILGTVTVDGLELRLDPDVYLPRWTTVAVARAAARPLPARGRAVDLATGCGVVAALLGRARPGAEVLATDTSATAVACARANGVDARQGDLFDPLPRSWIGTVDVVAAVPPFVPRPALDSLPADVRAHEPAEALDGGDDGLGVVRRLVAAAPRWLNRRGTLVVEVGPDQVDALADLVRSVGLDQIEVLVDDDGDPCGVSATGVRETPGPVDTPWGER